MEASPWFEQGTASFADCRLTVWLRRHFCGREGRNRTYEWRCPISICIMWRLLWGYVTIPITNNLCLTTWLLPDKWCTTAMMHRCKKKGGSQREWSEIRDSNPHFQRGRLACYHWTLIPHRTRHWFNQIHIRSFVRLLFVPLFVKRKEVLIWQSTGARGRSRTNKPLVFQTSALTTHMSYTGILFLRVVRYSSSHTAVYRRTQPSYSIYSRFRQ